MVGSRRSRSQFSQTWTCNSIKRLSYPPRLSNAWGECARVFLSKGSSVQKVLDPIFENASVQCEQKFVASITFFYEWWSCARFHVLKGSSVQTALQLFFVNVHVLCKNELFASTNCCFHDWGECVRALCASLFTLGKLGRILPPRLCEISSVKLNEAVHE